MLTQEQRNILNQTLVEWCQNREIALGDFKEVIAFIVAMVRAKEGRTYEQLIMAFMEALQIEELLSRE